MRLKCIFGPVIESWRALTLLRESKIVFGYRVKIITAPNHGHFRISVIELASLKQMAILTSHMTTDLITNRHVSNSNNY